MSLSAEQIFGRPQPRKAFDEKRTSLWHGDAPLTTDGSLLDDLLEAQEKARDAIQELTEARKASVDFADRDLSRAEVKLREAMALIAKLRQALASVPAEFGEV